MSRPRLMDTDAEMRRAGAAVLELDARAGVAADAERARDVFPYDTDSDAPFGSALAEAERQREEEDGHRGLSSAGFGRSISASRTPTCGGHSSSVRARSMTCGSRHPWQRLRPRPPG